MDNRGRKRCIFKKYWIKKGIDKWNDGKNVRNLKKLKPYLSDKRFY